jgi:hypothetical protein
VKIIAFISAPAFFVPILFTLALRPNIVGDLIVAQPELRGKIESLLLFG